MIGIGTAPLAEALAKIESLQCTIAELRTSPTMCAIREMIESQCAKENAELHRVIAEQKETIARVTNSDEHNFERWIACMETAKEQAELIEKLVGYVSRCAKENSHHYDRIECEREALAAVAKWKGEK